MSKNKTAIVWTVNVCMAFLFSILSITGLLNWWIIPHSHGHQDTFVFSLRHFIMNIHQWAALIFMIMVVVHIYLHWTYVIASLKKYGVLKK